MLMMSKFIPERLLHLYSKTFFKAPEILKISPFFFTDLYMQQVYNFYFAYKPWHEYRVHFYRFRNPMIQQFFHTPQLELYTLLFVRFFKHRTTKVNVIF